MLIAKKTLAEPGMFLKAYLTHFRLLNNLMFITEK